LEAYIPYSVFEFDITCNQSGTQHERTDRHKVNQVRNFILAAADVIDIGENEHNNGTGHPVTNNSQLAKGG
jgi:hypothetical protein